jgi:hypothetical protein
MYVQGAGVREGEHGRDAAPEEGGRGGVRGLRRARGGAQRNVLLRIHR